MSAGHHHLNSNDIVGQTIPNTGTANVYIANDSYASSVITVNPAQVRAWIQQQLYPARTVERSTAPPPPASSGAVPTKTAVSSPNSGCIH